MSVFACDVCALVCGADEELSLLPASEDSIFLSTSTGFIFVTFGFPTVVDVDADVDDPSLILVFAFVCRNRVC